MTGTLSEEMIPIGSPHARKIEQDEPRRELLIYLSGSIRKGSGDDRDRGNFWSEADEQALLRPVVSVNVTTLNPARSQLRRNDYYANFGCDLHLVAISDAVIVDARTEKGVGVGAEMMFARERGIPVITVAPQNTNYRRDFVPDVFGEDLHNWIHPFVYGLSTRIVDSFEEAGRLLEDLVTERWRPEPPQPVDDAMTYYLRVRETWTRKSSG